MREVPESLTACLIDASYLLACYTYRVYVQTLLNQSFEAKACLRAACLLSLSGVAHKSILRSSECSI